MIPGITAGRAVAASPVVYTDRIALPLTYDEDDYNGLLTWTRSGAGPHVMPDGMWGNGSDARYKATLLPSWLGVSDDLLLHATIVPRGSLLDYGTVDTGGRDIAVYVGPDDGGDNPKLSFDIRADIAVPSIPAVGVNYGGAAEILCRQGWRYEHRVPELSAAGFDARPQALVFLDSTTYLLTAHYEDTLSRCFKINAETGAVLGQFDFPATYHHVAGASIREDGTLWFGDYATGKLLRVDLAASLSGGTAVIDVVYDCSAITGFGAIAWARLGAASDEFLVAAEYRTSGTPYMYLIPAALVIDAAAFDVADRHKRFVCSQRIQGVTMHEGYLYTSQNRLTADVGNVGRIQQIDLSAESDGSADGATLAALETHYAPSNYPQDIDFHPGTGWCWTSTEGYTVVGDQQGWMGVWSGPLDGSEVANNYTAFYDGTALTLALRINNRDFRTVVAYTASDIPTAITVGGPPSGSANGHTTAIIRNVVISDQDMDAAGYETAVDGLYEPNTLQVIDVPLTNPGGESGTSGWTNEVGAIATRDFTPEPHTGLAYFAGGPNAATKSRERIDLVAATGLSTSDIDGDVIWARISWWQCRYSEADLDIAACGLRFLNGSPSTLVEATAPKVGPLPVQTWHSRSYAVAVPVGARFVDPLMDMVRGSGTNLDGYIDDIAVTLYRQ